MYVHDPERCKGEACVVHHPSDHHMNTWPTVYRYFGDYTERICPHGIGHPDPDSMAYKRRAGHKDTEGIHGCDGCCWQGPQGTEQRARTRLTY